MRRRKNKKTRFYIDKEFFEKGYASKYRKELILNVYCVLAKYANYETQVCFPSIATIMIDSGIKNKNSVMTALKILSKLNIINITHSKGRYSNTYMLLDAKSWRDPNSITGDTVEPYQKQNITVSTLENNSITGDTRNNIKK
jgi:hypothetical protein